MKTEATLLRAIAAASTLREQTELVGELDALRRAEATRLQDERDLDFSAAVVERTLTPALTHSFHTASTDWLDEVAPREVDTNHVIAEAALWFGKTSAAVKADADEFAEQARGQARRLAGAYGEQADAAERAYLDYVAFLHRREAASGLDQVQQLIDGNNNPKKTPLPLDTFDTFQDPVAPENQGVDEEQSSYNAPLMNEILQEGGGNGSPEIANGHGPGQMTGPTTNGSGFPVGASLHDEPVSLAIGHAYNLDEFRAAMAAQASVHQAADVPDAFAEHQFGNKAENDEAEKEKAESKKEAASTLPQVQQVVDSFENPAPTPMNTQVMFPLINEDREEPQTGTDAADVANHPGPGGGRTAAAEDPATAKDFQRAFAFAASWKPGQAIVRKGSAAFEAGLYAGMKENERTAQQAWLDAHAKWGEREEYFNTRIAVHAAFTAAEKTAGTSTDLDTMEPGLNNPQPNGDTPINGPGTVPPLAGHMDAAAPAGAAPYNGAEPFGAPVAPQPGLLPGHDRMAAFRARVSG